MLDLTQEEVIMEVDNQLKQLDLKEPNDTIFETVFIEKEVEATLMKT